MAGFAGLSRVHNWFSFGQEKDYKYLLIVRFDLEYDYAVFVKKNEDPIEIYERFNSFNKHCVVKTYDVTKDFLRQFEANECN